jgi:hypothetical protein
MENFYTKKALPLYLTKHGLGFDLGDFFTKTSGHPGWHCHFPRDLEEKVQF